MGVLHNGPQTQVPQPEAESQAADDLAAGAVQVSYVYSTASLTLLIAIFGVLHV
jgi:hypothetical protein